MPSFAAVLLLSLLLSLSSASAWWGSSKEKDKSDPIPKVCSNYEPVYRSIDRDLGFFKRMGGITPRLMAATIKMHTAHNREKGLAVAIYHGRVYVISDRKTSPMFLKPFGHHVTLWVAYLKVIMDLASRYGPALPNVEFVWHTIDRPVRLANASEGAINYPVFRFGKSPAHPDILIPNFHFYMKGYQSKYIDRIPSRYKDSPWELRKDVLFSRFSEYPRYTHPNDSYTQRLWLGGQPMCEVEGRSTSLCPVRIYLHEWSKNHTDKLDISLYHHVPFDEHAKWKYLLHVDGQGLSSKLEFLLTLGSLVFKEESGYEAYYHHLLKPNVHYVPVWKAGEGPEGMLTAVDWARDNDAKAREIAKAGQELASKYLTAEARACFWLRLLRAYAETMTYDPVSYRNITIDERTGEARGALRYIKPAQRWLDEDVRAHAPRLVEELDWEP
ncbi:hypothetical protein HYH03_015751 [Edaphochlamys debaryana]|uniref:Glycosyl transferase CAP10 domain-containing protein n=1 Tax=Edaphochlamys debaryana TaxID=47281 RepID=A0A835XKF5_9CHLO|nr:hypothetical protein HYH03_015751 [Edaphochlamys debaryana]|eukprot:KAG2485476.1 hypothetical protein HYH03_015751 [Edaphochlamys debaryana]